MVETKLNLLIIFGIFQSALAATLRCYDGSLTNFQSTPLEDPVPLLSSSCIDNTRPTVFYVFGLKENPDKETVKTILQAYLDASTTNVILVNWEEEASEDGHLGTVIGYALFSIRNTKKVGEELGKAIKDLVDAGLNRKIHCVGHSLGAHLVGFAAQWTKDNGLLLPRVTGLDPAGPLYDQPLAERLNKDCAEFVDTIHTNKGMNGTSLPLGKVNFWVNPSIAPVQIQPGCSPSPFELCSHQRSVYLFAEAVGSPTAFPAAGPTDYGTWAADKYTGGHIYIGEDTDTQAAAGNYYITTTGASPYSKGEAGLHPKEITKLTQGGSNVRDIGGIL